jgi:hypothetical protein
MWVHVVSLAGLPLGFQITAGPQDSLDILCYSLGRRSVCDRWEADENGGEEQEEGRPCYTLGD